MSELRKRGYLSEAGKGSEARDKIIERLKAQGINIDSRQPHDRMIYVGKKNNVQIVISDSGLWLKVSKPFPIESNHKKIAKVIEALGRIL